PTTCPVTSTLPVVTSNSRTSRRSWGLTAVSAPATACDAPTSLPSLTAVVLSKALPRCSFCSASTASSFSRSTTCSALEAARSVTSMSARPFCSTSYSRWPVLLSKYSTATLSGAAPTVIASASVSTQLTESSPG